MKVTSRNMNELYDMRNACRGYLKRKEDSESYLHAENTLLFMELENFLEATNQGMNGIETDNLKAIMKKITIAKGEVSKVLKEKERETSGHTDAQICLVWDIFDLGCGIDKFNLYLEELERNGR